MTTVSDSVRARYSALKSAGKLACRTVKAAVAIRQEREAHKPTRTPSLEERLQSRRVRVPLGPQSATEVRDKARDQFPRRKNWRSPVSVVHVIDRRVTQDGIFVRDVNLGRYSSRCTYTHYEYEPQVTSCAVVSPRVLLYRYGSRPLDLIRAPRGYRWAADANGVKLVANSDPRADFHPTADDLLYRKAQDWVAEIKKNLATRRELARKSRQQLSAVRRAEREGCRVCLADSLRAGNCRAGTLSFATRHNLDPAKHYRPSEVLAQANGDASRVALVVTVALKRHREEMSRGFALLSEHRS